MTPREFFNAWIGWRDSRNEELEAIRSIHYGAARFHGAATAFSKEQAKAISGHRFPWEKVKADSISVHDKIGSFIRREERRLRKKHGN